MLQIDVELVPIIITPQKMMRFAFVLCQFCSTYYDGWLVSADWDFNIGAVGESGVYHTSKLDVYRDSLLK